MRELTRAWSSRRWPTREAVIVSAAVHERRGSRGRTLFEPTIQFKYRFRDVEYVGHRIAFGDVGRSNRAEAEKIADRFATGTVWSVRICERRPEIGGPSFYVWRIIGGRSQPWPFFPPGLTAGSGLPSVLFVLYLTLAIAFLVDAVRKPSRALSFFHA